MESEKNKIDEKLFPLVKKRINDNTAEKNQAGALDFAKYIRNPLPLKDNEKWTKKKKRGKNILRFFDEI